MKLWIILALVGVAVAAPISGGRKRVGSVSVKKLVDGEWIVVEKVIDPDKIRQIQNSCGDNINKVLVDDANIPQVGDVTYASDIGIPCDDYIDVGVPELAAPDLYIPAPCVDFDIPCQTKTVAPCTVQRQPCYCRSAPEPCEFDVDGVRWRCTRIGRSSCSSPSLPCGRLVNRACYKNLAPCGVQIVTLACDDAVVPVPCLPETVVIEDPCIVPDVKVDLPCIQVSSSSSASSSASSSFSSSFGNVLPCVEVPEIKEEEPCVEIAVVDEPCEDISFIPKLSGFLDTIKTRVTGCGGLTGGSSTFASSSSSSSASASSASSSSSSFSLF